MDKRVHVLIGATVVLLFAAMAILTACRGPGAQGAPDEVAGPVYEEVTLPVAGGVILCGSGITITVPPGAVPEDTPIQVRRLPADEALKTLTRLGLREKDVLVAWEALPHGLAFASPLTFSISGLDLAGVLPIAHELDLATGSYVVADAPQVSDPDAGTLALEVSHFSAYAQTAGRRVADSECVSTPCRCHRIRVESSDADYACSAGDCQITESTLRVAFLDCPGQPVEEATLREIGPGCQITMQLSPADSVIRPNETTTITAKALIGCAPLSNQLINLSLSNSGLGSVDPAAASTDENGVRTALFTASNTTGTVVVTAHAEALWYGYTIITNDQTFNGPRITRQASAQTTIEIVNGYTMYLSSGEPSIPPGFETDIFGGIVDGSGNIVMDQPITLTHTGNGSLSITNDTGFIAAVFKADVAEGTAEITASATFTPPGSSAPVTLRKTLGIEVRRRPVQHWQGKMVISESGHSGYGNLIEDTLTLALDLTFDPNKLGPDSSPDDSNLTGTVQLSHAVSLQNGPVKTFNGKTYTPFWGAVTTLTPALVLRGSGLTHIRPDRSSYTILVVSVADMSGEALWAATVIKAEDKETVCSTSGCDTNTDSYEAFVGGPIVSSLCFGTTDSCPGSIGAGLLILSPVVEDTVGSFSKSGTSRAFLEEGGTVSLEMHRVE